MRRGQPVTPYSDDECAAYAVHDGAFPPDESRLRATPLLRERVRGFVAAAALVNAYEAQRCAPGAALYVDGALTSDATSAPYDPQPDYAVRCNARELVEVGHQASGGLERALSCLPAKRSDLPALFRGQPPRPGAAAPPAQHLRHAMHIVHPVIILTAKYAISSRSGWILYEMASGCLTGRPRRVDHRRRDVGLPRWGDGTLDLLWGRRDLFNRQAAQAVAALRSPPCARPWPGARPV
jgi:hypothetical protein